MDNRIRQDVSPKDCLTDSRHLASIGCIAVILSFAFEPFVQNLVHYVSVSVEDSFHIAHLANTSIYKTVGPGFNEEYRKCVTSASSDQVSAIDEHEHAQIVIPTRC